MEGHEIFICRVKTDRRNWAGCKQVYVRLHLVRGIDAENFESVM